MAEEAPLQTEEAQKDALKNVGNTKRYQIEKECMKNYFELGKHKLKNVDLDREKEICKGGAQIEIKLWRRKFLNKKFDKNLAGLDDIVVCVDNRDDKRKRRVLEWEVEAKQLLK